MTGSSLIPVPNFIQFVCLFVLLEDTKDHYVTFKNIWPQQRGILA